jgi:hypothetical protein
MAAWQMSRLPALGTACPAIALATAGDAALQRFGFRISIPDSDSDCIVPAQCVLWESRSTLVCH